MARPAVTSMDMLLLSARIPQPGPACVQCLLSKQSSCLVLLGLNGPLETEYPPLWPARMSHLELCRDWD